MVRVKIVIILMLVCTGVVPLTMPKSAGPGKKALDEVMEDKGANNRQNYLVQRGQNGGIIHVDPIWPPYERAFEPAADRPNFMDIADMMRNDLTSLNRPVKRAFKAIPGSQCSCEYTDGMIELGIDYYPQYVESRTCGKGTCPSPYKCKEIYHTTVVFKKTLNIEEMQVGVPKEFYGAGWVATRIDVPSGCACG